METWRSLGKLGMTMGKSNPLPYPSPFNGGGRDAAQSRAGLSAPPEEELSPKVTKVGMFGFVAPYPSPFKGGGRDAVQSSAGAERTSFEGILRSLRSLRMSGASG